MGPAGPLSGRGTGSAFLEAEQCVYSSRPFVQAVSVIRAAEITVSFSPSFLSSSQGLRGLQGSRALTPWLAQRLKARSSWRVAPLWSLLLCPRPPVGVAPWSLSSLPRQRQSPGLGLRQDCGSVALSPAPGLSGFAAWLGESQWLDLMGLGTRSGSPPAPHSALQAIPCPPF